VPERRGGRFAVRIRGFLDEVLDEHAKTLIALVPAGLVPPPEADGAERTADRRQTLKSTNERRTSMTTGTDHGSDAFVAPDHSRAALAELASLEGRTAVVTAGGAGIGAAIAARLAEAGAAVTVADLDPAAASRTVEQVEAGGGTATAMRMDVTDEGEVEAVAATVFDTHGRLDIWVNNAGLYPRGSILDIEPDEWDQVMAVNVRGAYLGSRAAARRMIAAGSGGSIVTITSCASFNSSDGGNGAHYVASKHALAGLTKSMAVQLSPHGIRALAVAPTLTRTEGVERDRAGGHAEMLDAFAARVPAGRMAVPDDVARVVAFAVSDAAAYVSGSTIIVDGGNLAR
jgi:NAD(P)-dependent dehydrogenase (short-subunit alcohol dehydrogenase family)